jgi:hypothetical protein
VGSRCGYGPEGSRDLDLVRFYLPNQGFRTPESAGGPPPEAQKQIKETWFCGECVRAVEDAVQRELRRGRAPLSGRAGSEAIMVKKKVTRKVTKRAAAPARSEVAPQGRRFDDAQKQHAVVLVASGVSRVQVAATIVLSDSYISPMDDSYIAPS